MPNKIISLIGKMSEKSKGKFRLMLERTERTRPRIFISYRRDDSDGYAGRLYDRLSTHFGAENVFMDIDAIPLGQNFVKVINENVRSCHVLIAVIGKHWLTCTDDRGQSRLSNPEDFVQLEIYTALMTKILVIPILVGRARMANNASLWLPLGPHLRP
jgi:hypothetical protein